MFESRFSRRTRCAMFTLVLALSAVVLWVWFRAVGEMQALSRPAHRDTVWHVMQVSHLVHHLGESAEKVRSGTASPETLGTRLDLLQAQLTAVREDAAVARPDFDGRHELIFIESRIAAWQARLEGPAPSDELAEDILGQDGAMRQAALDLLVKTHLDNAARRDEARQELLQDFYTQAMAMVALVAGLAILALGMRGQYRRVARLAADLRTLNQTLEARVEERTRAIEDKQQLLQSVLEANPSAVVVLRASDAQVLYANAPLLRALGLKCVPAEPLPLSRLFVDPVRAQEIGEELRLLRRVDGWEAEVAGPHGFPAVVHAREVAVAGEPAHLIWLHDHSDWKALEEELRLRATTDGLTGLMNRRYFMDIAEQALDTCRRYGHPCSVLMLDADHFKAINDRYGHPVGDEVLVALARVLRKMLRRSDLIARYGGEEFVMLLPHTSAAAALATAQRLCERCGQLVLSRSEGTVRVTVSIGVATWVAGESLARMLSRADAALYVAKARGRNQCATEADVTPVTSPDLLTDTAV